MAEPEAVRSVFITSPPGTDYFEVKDLAGHHIRKPPDPDLAVGQHQSLVSLIRAAGCSAIDVPGIAGHPNSVFTKDTALCTPQGYIRLRMGLPTRRGEDSWMAGLLEGMGIPCMGTITPPGTLEGGDVILADRVAFLGLSSRSNREGIRQLAAILTRLGYEIRMAAVPEPFLHIGGAMTLVAPDAFLAAQGLFSEEFFRDFIQIKVPHGGFISGNVIPLGNNRVIAEQGNQPAIVALQDNGYKVYPLDLSEFVKGTGGPSCLIMEIPCRTGCRQSTLSID